MKYMANCGKRNRDYAAWRTNAVNLVVASVLVYEIGLRDPAVCVSGWNARVLRVKKSSLFFLSLHRTFWYM